MTVCGFCKNQPVVNAASWLDGRPRPPAECPRCGKTFAQRAPEGRFPQLENGVPVGREETPT